MNWLRWQQGRQATGYDKLLIAGARWPVAFDVYLLCFRKGSEIPPHTDPVDGKRHYRLNIVLRAAARGGEFVCAAPIYASRRIKFFRPDACEHAVTRIEEGTRYVLSIGYVLNVVD